MNPYRSKEWNAFREEVMRLDNFQCVECGRTKADGVIFHIHHKSYQDGKLPWEYDFDQCETLCAGCHAAHHGKIPPKVGWMVVGIDDLESQVGKCELCGTAIRHVFLVLHPNWVTMEVGEICCDHLTSTDIATNYMESIRRYNGRRKRFVRSSRWKKRTERHFYIVHNRIVVEERISSAGYLLRMNGKRGRVIYRDSLEARMRAFDVLESGRHRDYLANIQKTRIPLSWILEKP